MTAMIASAGQAVYFIAHATPSTSAAAAKSRPLPLPPAARPLRASSASARQVSAITGGSVMPIVSGNAMTGQASQNAAAPRAARRSPAAPRRQRHPERRVQQQERRGDQPGPRLTGSAERPGSPNRAMTGRYGL